MKNWPFQFWPQPGVLSSLPLESSTSAEDVLDLSYTSLGDKHPAYQAFPRFISSRTQLSLDCNSSIPDKHAHREQDCDRHPISALPWQIWLAVRFSKFSTKTSSWTSVTQSQRSLGRVHTVSFGRSSTLKLQPIHSIIRSQRKQFFEELTHKWIVLQRIIKLEKVSRSKRSPMSSASRSWPSVLCGRLNFCSTLEVSGVEWSR